VPLSLPPPCLWSFSHFLVSSTWYFPSIAPSSSSPPPHCPVLYSRPPQFVHGYVLRYRPLPTGLALSPEDGTLINGLNLFVARPSTPFFLWRNVEEKSLNDAWFEVFSMWSLVFAFPPVSFPPMGLLPRKKENDQLVCIRSLSQGRFVFLEIPLLEFPSSSRGDVLQRL